MPIIDFKATMCKHCYKCVRNCDVKAIMVKDGRANIMPSRCILCGECLHICPQSAKVSMSDMELVRQLIGRGEKVIATISSSFLGLMDYGTPGQVKGALLKLGFSDVREAAEGAALATQAYLSLLEAGRMDNIICSSCPSINEMIEIHYPQLIPCLAPVETPAVIHARMLKQELGEDCKVIFIGPCIAKKRECRDGRSRGSLDGVLTFEDLNQWMREEKVAVSQCEDIPFGGLDAKVNRLYPVAGGVITALEVSGENKDDYRKFFVGGVRDCITACESMVEGQVKHCFIEMSACSGGCINGPTADSRISRFHAKLAMEEMICLEPVRREDLERAGAGIPVYKEFRDRSRKEETPTDGEIREILKKTGKTKPEHELNCGACGYPTCREKAVAVYQKKAELDMCIPYMHDRAESLANLVMETSPNIIMVLDENMRILECSRASEKYFKKTRGQLLRCKLDDFIDTEDFREVLSTHRNIHSKKVTYPEYNLSTLQNIAYIEKGNFVIATFIDITKEEEQAKAEYHKKLETIELAQKVIYKQMMVAQEIAGLLGETTAETKTTLTTLCRSLLDDGDESEVK